MSQLEKPGAGGPRSMLGLDGTTCYEADACSLDPSCPFVYACERAETGPDTRL